MIIFIKLGYPRQFLEIGTAISETLKKIITKSISIPELIEII